MTKNLHQRTVKMKIHVETALRNVYEGTKLVFGILFPREFNVLHKSDLRKPFRYNNSFEPKERL